jgi:hypothetical protein
MARVLDGFPVDPDYLEHRIVGLQDENEALKRAVRRMLRAEEGSSEATRRWAFAWSDGEVEAARPAHRGWERAGKKYRAQVEQLLEREGKA